MKTINFTQEHKARLDDLAVKFLFLGITIKGSLGVDTTVYDLIHNTTINSLNNIKASLDRAISAKENEDEWIQTDEVQNKTAQLKEKREFINLLVGYKRWISNNSDIEAHNAKVMAKIKELKESTMTPEDQIKALEESLIK